MMCGRVLKKREKEFLLMGVGGLRGGVMGRKEEIEGFF
jgi:hypothetical protein